MTTRMRTQRLDEGTGFTRSKTSPSSPPRPPEPAARPPVEVELRDIRNSAALARHGQRAFEIWTKNRSYALDAKFECWEVVDLATGAADPNHAFLGCRMVGGQRRTETGRTLLSFPLPTPGAEAVFQKFDANGKMKMSITSKVKRVIVYVHVVRVDVPEQEAVWGKITRTGH
ncbi:MAG: hypothetical protein IT376_17795 [Polyangiaceae bacterium]|nr:hypothetical protein [Polyangiaceae bacterium]